MKSLLTPYEVIRSSDPQACLKVAQIRDCCVNDIVRACWQYYYAENKRLLIQEEKYSEAIATLTQRTDPKAPGFEELRDSLIVLRDDAETNFGRFSETFDRFAQRYPRPSVEDKKRTPTSILHDAYRMAEHHPKPTTKRKEEPTVEETHAFSDGGLTVKFNFQTTELASEFKLDPDEQKVY